MQAGEGRGRLSFSPSFNRFSSGRLAEIAARVVEEFRHESESQSNVIDWGTTEDLILYPEQNFPIAKPQEAEKQSQLDGKHDGDDDFEFAFVCREPDSSPVSADEIFFNGQIRPVFPLFDTSLLMNGSENGEDLKKSKTAQGRRMSLRKLMREERETASCSSSEADELEGVLPGTYCVWTPKSTEVSLEKCKTSNSTNSSKRWKFLNLLNRSNSDGKDVFVFTPPNKKDIEVDEVLEEKWRGIDEKINGKVKPSRVAAATTATAAPTATDGENRAMKVGDKRRSYLPYKKDLVGFFSNVNGMSRN